MVQSYALSDALHSFQIFGDGELVFCICLSTAMF